MAETKDTFEQHEKCKAWRIRNRYTVTALSKLTGYSTSSINDFEVGIVRGEKNRPVAPSVMRRYRLCLAAISAGLADWDYT